jgi:hypothetical protein
MDIPLYSRVLMRYSIIVVQSFNCCLFSMDEEGKKAVQPFLDKERFDVDGQKEAINYPILFANDTIAEKFGGVMGLPTSLLFNRQGKENKKILGPVDLKDISKDIEDLL